MITIRKSSQRGKADHGWLKALHSFSFANYYDPTNMGFSVLRVINEDRIAPAAGFPRHSHKDMEIITYILEGELQHKDSMGNASIIKPGEVQYMCAGKGVTHSEFNSSQTVQTHLMQIWIEPDKDNYPASYNQKDYSFQLLKNDFVLIVSSDGSENSIKINQNVRVYALKAESAGEKIHNLILARSYWIQVAKGVIKINDLTLAAGDSLQAVSETRLHFQWQSGCELLFFDLP
jgi:redox-sensitive bicupin YhaK (pirin superfamily)